MPLSTQCLIALGGNVGVSGETFASACEVLAASGAEVEQLSAVIRTPAVGANAGAEFLNAAALLTTSLTAPDLLRTLHRVENQFGRKRTVHWGPRTLDLDLILYGDSVIDSEEVVVPHPAMWYRRFVLFPAAEVAPAMRHPLLDRTVEQLLRRLNCLPLVFHLPWQDVFEPVEMRDLSLDLTVSSGNRHWLSQLCRQLRVSVPEHLAKVVISPPDIEGERPFAELRFSAEPSVSDSSSILAGSEFLQAAATRRRQPSPRGDFVIELSADSDCERAVQDIVIAATGGGLDAFSGVAAKT